MSISYNISVCVKDVCEEVVMYVKTSGFRFLLLILLSNLFFMSCSSESEGTASIAVYDSASIHIENGVGSIYFGSIDIGANKTENFTIENNSTVNLNLNGNPTVEITGVGASSFKIVSYPSTPIKSNTSRMFTIEFSPNEAKYFSATVTIVNSSPDENPYTFTISGAGRNTTFDFNGDGIDDVIVGASYDDDAGQASGCAFIFFGNHSSSSPINASDANVKLIGETAGDTFGTSVSSAGDFNNDGFDDVIVSAPYNKAIDVGSGRAYIIFGKTNPPNVIHASNADVIFNGEAFLDTFGFSVSSAGDFNNDGFDDILVGAPQDDDGGAESGCSFIFFGSSNPPSIIDAANADIKLIGEDTEDDFGFTVSSIGDFNADGFSDVIVGARWDDDGGDKSGCAFIFFGSANPPVQIDAANANVKLIGKDSGDYFGYCVSSAGDFNDDGFDDTIVGALNVVNNGSKSGCAYIFFGNTNPLVVIDASNADVKIIGETMLGRLGISVSYAGDLNHDGIDDVILGCHYETIDSKPGDVIVFFGSKNPPTTINASKADIKITGEDADDQFGNSISSAGDFNIDGVTDIIVGARNSDDSGDYSGCAFIFYGKSNLSSTIDAANADVKIIGEDAGDKFGGSVAGGR